MPFVLESRFTFFTFRSRKSMQIENVVTYFGCKNSASIQPRTGSLAIIGDRIPLFKRLFNPSDHILANLQMSFRGLQDQRVSRVNAFSVFLYFRRSFFLLFPSIAQFFRWKTWTIVTARNSLGRMRSTSFSRVR